MPRTIPLPTALVLVVAGAVVGAVTASLVTRAVEPGPAEGPASAPPELLLRLEQLEAQVEDRRRKRRPRATPGSTGSPDATDGTEADDGPTHGARAADDDDVESRSASGEDALPGSTGSDGSVDEAFVQRVGEAIRTLQERAAGERQARKQQEDRARALRELSKKLREYVPRLGLDEATATAFVEATTAGTTRLLDAQAAGMDGDTLATMTRENQQRYQDLLGDAGYRELRKLELDAAARPSIVSIAGQAGVDGEQREQIERLLTDHIERLVDLDVRARTQELSPDEMQSIRERMNDANRDAWDRLRRDILTDEQRDRVPRRLR